MTARLTRRYRFSASHRLHSPELSAAENERLYGKCNNPYGHGHDYELEVTVSGTLDERTGRVLPLRQLDRLVQETILQLFAHRNINLDVPQFAHLVPTTENIVLVISELLQQKWPAYFDRSSAHLERVHLQETGRNGFELLLGMAANTPEKNARNERLSVNA